MDYRKKQFKPEFESDMERINLRSEYDLNEDKCDDGENRDNAIDDEKFRPQFEPLKEEDIVDANIQHDKSFTEKILDQRYGKDAFVPNSSQEKYGKTPILVDLYILLVRISFVYPVVIIIFHLDHLKWTLWVWLLCLLVQYFLVYKYKKPQPFKCTVCGEVKVPNKLMWMTMYNFPSDRMWCDNCCKSRRFIKIKEDDENNWDNELKRY